MKTNKMALEEYALADEEGRIKLVYTYYGLAIYVGQALEEAFSAMLWTDAIFKKKPRTNKEVNDIIDDYENSKRTMGQFIQAIQQAYDLPDELIHDLSQILHKRNHMVHKYFKMEAVKFQSDLGRKEMIEYFCEFIDESERIRIILDTYYSHYTDKMGLTEEYLQGIMSELIQKEINRELENI